MWVRLTFLGVVGTLFSVDPIPEGTDTKTEEEKRKFRPQHGSGSNRTSFHFIYKAIDDGM
jgi:hypothetical protein